MIQLQSLYRPLLAITLIIGLSACGGGGEGNTTNPRLPIAPGAPVTPGTPSTPPTGNTPTPPATLPPATGPSWQSGSTLPTQAATKVFAPAVAMASNGQAHVMWIQHEGLSPAIGKLYAARASVEDGRWSAPALLAEGRAGDLPGWDSTTGLGDGYNSIAMLPLGTGGDMLAVWGTSQNHSVGPLMLRRFSASARQWSEPEVLVGTHAGRFRTASSPEGHALLAWYSSGGTQILVIDAQGQRRVLALPGKQAHKLAINSQGKVAATWTDVGSQYLAVSDSASWSEAIQLPGRAMIGEGWADLRIADDGELALAWTLPSFEIASLVLRADGSYELATAVRALSSSGKPSLVRGPNGWQMAFVGSHHSPDYFANGSVLMNAPYATAHRWGSGWSSPQAISATGAAGTGSIDLLRTAADEITALVTGYNIGGYTLKDSAPSWSAETIAYDGMRPAAAAQGTGGHAVIAWSEGVVLKTQFRR